MNRTWLNKTNIFMSKNKGKEEREEEWHEKLFKPFQDIGEQLNGFFAQFHKNSQNDKKGGYKWVNDQELLIEDFERVFGNPPVYNDPIKKKKDFFKYVQKMQHILGNILFSKLQKNQTINFYEVNRTKIYFDHKNNNVYKEYLDCMNYLSKSIGLKETASPRLSFQLPSPAQSHSHPEPLHLNMPRDSKLNMILNVWLESNEIQELTKAKLRKGTSQFGIILKPADVYELVKARFLPPSTNTHTENNLDDLLQKALQWDPSRDVQDVQAP